MRITPADLAIRLNGTNVLVFDASTNSADFSGLILKNVNIESQTQSGDLNLNNYKITNLALATQGTDALSQDAGDARYYSNSVSLDAIEPPTTTVSMNGQKVTDLGNATFGTDALNRDTADARYYLNDTTLDAIDVPIAPLDINA